MFIEKNNSDDLSSCVLTRRQFIGYSLFIPSALVIANCSPALDSEKVAAATPTTVSTGMGLLATGYPLEDDGKDLVDRKLTESQHPLIESVRFYFDPNYANGSLAMQLWFRTNVLYRIVSEEVKPRPGYLVNLPYRLDRNGIVKYPVIELALSDDERVFLGAMKPEQSCDDLYKDMRAYHLTRKLDGNLSGEFTGVVNLNPENIQPRKVDAAQLVQYFIPDCNNPRV